jgi:hypothetical protein
MKLEEGEDGELYLLGGGSSGGSIGSASLGESELAMRREAEQE